MDEYKESEMADWQRNKLHELLRKAATGGVEQRGNADKTTDEYHLRAPTVVSGETRVRGSAEQRRAIDVAFRDECTDPSSPEFDRFKTLVGDATTDEDGNVSFPESDYQLEEHAVAFYSFVACMDDEEFNAAWVDAREHVSARVADWDVELDGMEIQGLQTVVFGVRMMREFAETVGADVSVLPGEDELDDALRYVADVDGPGRELHTDEFVKLLQRAQAAEYLEYGTHWTVVNGGKANAELRVSVSRCYDAISKFVTDHDLNADLLGSPRDYRDRFDEEVDKDGWVECTSQNSPPVGRCVGIRAARAAEEIDGFDPETFFTGTPAEDVLVIDYGDEEGDGETRDSALKETIDEDSEGINTSPPDTTAENHVHDMISNLSDEIDGGVPGVDVIDALVDETDIDRAEYRDALQALKSRGQIYEQESGRWRCA